MGPKINLRKSFWIALTVVLCFWAVPAQVEMNGLPNPTPTPEATLAISGPKDQLDEVPRERRERAYAKLLEGQRHIWSLSNMRTDAGITSGTLLAKESIQEAIELDPTLAEGYTALAELTYRSPPNDLDEAVRLARIAVRLNPDNFGGHQILARLFTIKSRINRGVMDSASSQQAIKEWQEVGRLDPRNAEAFAFLSEFYGRTERPKDKIVALKKWLSSATPIDSRFYRGIMQQQDLAPESALLKLGGALLQQGETKEAVEILGRAVADDPGSDEAVELLSRAIEAADDKTAATAIESLQQAIYANTENAALPVLLAQIRMRIGSLDEAARSLRDKIAELSDKDKVSASNMQMSLGDLYLDAGRYEEAVASYKAALVTRGIDGDVPATDDDREFTALAYEKSIRAFKAADRISDAVRAIEESRIAFGSDDLFADKQLISLYRETGKKAEALQLIGALRSHHPHDYELLRLEASTLTEFDRVDEGVALLRGLIGKKPAENGSSTFLAEYDDFMNYLHISGLYSKAKRGKAAVEAANQAILAAKNEDRKKIGRLTLATAQQTAGDFAGAEQTLREILRQTPGYPSALNNLGYLLVERNEKLTEALELILQAVGIDPTNPSYVDSLGWAYFKLDKLDEAVKALKSAVRLSSGSATALEHLGDVYQKQGNIELAKTTWQKALRATSDKTAVNRLKSKLQIKAGN